MEDLPNKVPSYCVSEHTALPPLLLLPLPLYSGPLSQDGCRVQLHWAILMLCEIVHQEIRKGG